MTSRTLSETHLREFLHRMFGREPTDNQLAVWRQRLDKASRPEHFLAVLMNSKAMEKAREREGALGPSKVEIRTSPLVEGAPGEEHNPSLHASAARRRLELGTHDESPSADGPGTLPRGRFRPDRVRKSITVDGVTLDFDVVENSTGPLYFSMGVRKSGSTLLHKIVSWMARRNAVNQVDIPGVFFRGGLGVSGWTNLDLQEMLRPGNVYMGFRSFPRTLSSSEPYKDALKIFMYRDPRDAIVSQYFSDAFSHELPNATKADGRERFLKKREVAQNTQIDEWVLSSAPSLARTLEAFAPVLKDPKCKTLSYEEYVFDKPKLIDVILQQFGWKLRPEQFNNLLAEVDIVPSQEDPNRFVRKATPGDHKEKLRGETIDQINQIFAKSMDTFGYK